MSDTVSPEPEAVQPHASEDPETGEIVNLSTEHGLHVVHAGGHVVRLGPGDSFIPAKDGAPAVVMRRGGS